MRAPAVPSVLVVALALAGCGQGKDQGGVKYPYPANVQANILKSCETGQRPDRCRCALEAIENRIPYDRFKEIDREVARRSFPPDLVAAVRGCQRPAPK